MSRNDSHPTDPDVLAVLHLAGGSWRLLVAREERRPTILETAVFPSAMPDTGGPTRAVEGLRARLEHHAPGRLIVVLPAAGVVCRTCTLPHADPADLEAALELQAEALVPADTPAHRLAMAVLPAAAGETSRSGIILSWPETAAVPAIPETSAEFPVSYAADVAAMAALLNGLRPRDPLVWLDRQSGSIGLAVTHPGGAVFRATREEPTAADWPARVERTLAETALGSGHRGSFAGSIVERTASDVAAIEPGAAAFLIPDEIMASASGRLDGLPAGADADPGWWSTFGIAAGALLAATGELRALTELRRAAGIEQPSRLRQIQAALSRPQTALATSLLCLIMIGALPVITSGLRLAILHLRHPRLAAQVETIERTTDKLAIYAALEGQAWSMTKLLADIVSNTPEGIELSSIRLLNSDRSFFVSGTARKHQGKSAVEIVASMQGYLQDCRLFGEIKLNWGDGNNYGEYQFELSAKVINPHRRPTYPLELDFALWPLVDRQGGRGPRDPDADTGEKADEEFTIADAGDRSPVKPFDDDPDVTLTGDADDGAGVAPSGAIVMVPAGNGGVMRGSRRIGDGRAQGTVSRQALLQEGPDPGAIPEALTQAMVDSMTLDEVRSHQQEIAEARRRVRHSDDDELRQRLKDEFYMLQARLRELR